MKRINLVYKYCKGIGNNWNVSPILTSFESVIQIEHNLCTAMILNNFRGAQKRVLCSHILDFIQQIHKANTFESLLSYGLGCTTLYQEDIQNNARFLE